MATLMEKVIEIMASVKTPELAAELVLRLAREEHFREFERDRQRDLARTRKRQQRDRERDPGVTSAGQAGDPVVTSPPLDPPSVMVVPERSGSGSPDPSEPDQGDPPPDEPAAAPGRYSAEFLKLWSWYPRKVGIEAAWQAWLRQRPPLEDCRKALQWQRLTRQWREERKVPNLERWIEERRWLDERDISVTEAGRRPFQAEPMTSPAARGWTNGGGR